jgi:hypothetical protein
MNMSKQEKAVETWPDLAIGLYDKLTGRNAEITYDFQDFKVQVPRKVGSTEKTEWQLDGKLIVSTSENNQ